MSNLTRTFAREAKDIETYHSRLVENVLSAGKNAELIGETLRRVKEKIDHGQFEKWVEDNCPFGPRQAQKYLQFQARVQSLTDPPRELIDAEWRELTYPQKRTDCALLPPSETQALMESEGGVEPEERETQPPAKTEVKTSVSVEADPTKSPDWTSKSPVTEPSQSEEDEGDTEAPADADGVPIPASLAPIFSVAEQFESLARSISILKGQIEDAVEGSPEAFSSLSHQQVSADLSGLRQRMTEAIPYLICPMCGGEDPQKTCKLCNGRGWLSRFRARTVAIELRNPQRKAHGLALLTGTSQRAGEETR